MSSCTSPQVANRGGCPTANVESVPTALGTKGDRQHAGINYSDVVFGFNSLFEQSTTSKISIDFVVWRVMQYSKLDNAHFERVKTCLVKYLAGELRIYYKNNVRAKLRVSDTIDSALSAARQFNSMGTPETVRTFQLADTESPLRVYSDVMPIDAYSRFKVSLMEDTLLYHECKWLKGNLAKTKRLYAAFGQCHTGMFYNGIYLPADTSCPESVRFIIESALKTGLMISKSLCVMITVYPPCDKDTSITARAAGKKMHGMAYHSDGADKTQGLYLGDPSKVAVHTFSGFIDPLNIGRQVACNDWYFTVKHNESGVETPFQLHDNCLLVQPRGMQTAYKHKVHGTYNSFMRWVATVRDVDGDYLQAWLCRKKKVVEAAKFSKHQSLREWLTPSEQWIVRRLAKPSRPPTECSAVVLGTCVNCKQAPSKDQRCCPSPVVYGDCDLQIGLSYTKDSVFQSSFFSRSDLGASMEKSKEYGIAAMYLTSQHRLNDWSRWNCKTRPTIRIAGAGGRKKQRNQWHHVAPQSLAQNSAFFFNITHGTPVRILVQDDKDTDCFIYTGLWRVYNSMLHAGDAASDGQPVFLTTLLREESFNYELTKETFVN